MEHCARRFRNRGEPFEDLVQVGTIGLLKSIDRFDLERGVEFSTYATPTIIGEIKRHFRDKGWAIRVPRRLQELRMQIGSASAELTQSLGRSPTPRELAEQIGCSVEDILEGIESSNAYSTLSLDAGDDSEDGAATMLDAIGVDDENLEHVEIRESIKPLLDRLDAREKRILLLRFFKNMTQSQIAEEIGVSQMHVSRLLTRTLEQLRTSLEADDGREPGRSLALVLGQRPGRRRVQHADERDHRDQREHDRGAVVSPPQKLNASSSAISWTATTGPRAHDRTWASPRAQASSPAPMTTKNRAVVTASTTRAVCRLASSRTPSPTRASPSSPTSTAAPRSRPRALPLVDLGHGPSVGAEAAPVGRPFAAPNSSSGRL